MSSLLDNGPPAPVGRARRGNRRTVLALVVVVLLVAAAVLVTVRHVGQEPAGAGPPGSPSDWNLIFADEFSGTELDTTRWIPCLSAGWTMAEPQPGCPTWGTQLQTYRTRNVSVSDGSLHLTATKEPDGTISSGSLSTAEDVYGYDQPGYRPFGYRYGYFEARLRSADDSGMWPAVWEMPVGGGARGEMDLFEIMGTRDDPQRIKMSLHGDVPAVVVGQATPQIPDIAENFHVFGVEWAPDHVTFFVDGRPVNRITGGLPEGSHFIQANLAVGGEFVPPVSPDQEYPRELEIDYMRVYQRN